MRTFAFTALVAAAVLIAVPLSRASAQVPVGATVRISDPVHARTGQEAILAFVPDVAVFETGGVCTLSHPTESNITRVTAYFPKQEGVKMIVSLVFDSAGHLAKYSERRGIAPSLGDIRQLSNAQRDSATKAADATVRTTSISFDYSVSQAVAANMGGGMPNDVVAGTIRVMEKLESLGVPSARIERVRTLCGV